MDPFLGEIKIVGFDFAPQGWAFCDGQALQINQNSALYSLLGNTYGGDGITTFALPNLQGCLPLEAGNGFTLGNKGGEAAHALTTNEIPAHTHSVSASNADPNASAPTGNVWAKSSAAYQTGAGNASLNQAAVGNAGSGQAHPNLQPYLVLNFVIATVGIYPTRS
jgi:microcystin-dependent protein